MSPFKDYCIRVFSKVNPNATFLSIKGYQNNFQEVSDFSVVFNANYLNAVQKAKEIVDKSVFVHHNDTFSHLDFDNAKSELLESFYMTLSGFNPLYTCQGVYEDIIGSDGHKIPGIKLHTDQDVMHVNALRVRKRVNVPGYYKDVNSAAKTVAKRYLKSLTPLSRWVQFKLVPSRFEQLVIQKMVLEGR